MTLDIPITVEFNMEIPLDRSTDEAPIYEWTGHSFVTRQPTAKELIHLRPPVQIANLHGRLLYLDQHHGLPDDDGYQKDLKAWPMPCGTGTPKNHERRRCQRQTVSSPSTGSQSMTNTPGTGSVNEAFKQFFAISPTASLPVYPPLTTTPPSVNERSVATGAAKASNPQQQTRRCIGARSNTPAAQPARELTKC